MIQHLDQNTDYRSGQNWRITILLIWIFSGIGIPVLQFSASLLVWMGLLFLMCFKPILKLPFKTIFLTTFIICLYFIIFVLKGAPIPLFVGVAILSALFVLSNYLDGSYKFFYDFSRLCKGFMYFTLFSVPIMIFAAPFLTPINFDYHGYNTFGYLFWFTPNGGPSIFSGFRFTGIVWEPGIWQIFLNINLLYALFERRSNLQVFLAFIASLSCFSTTGFIVVGITLVLYVIFSGNRFRLRFNQMLAPGLVTVFVLPLILDNFSTKVFYDAMGSGTTRIADFFTGMTVLLSNPILGADVETAIAENNELIYALKESFWRGNYWDGAFGNYMSVANSNGYVIFLLDWGLLFGIIFLLNLFRTNLTPNRQFNTICILIILISMSAEAISRTSFFYFFILAAIFTKKPTKKRNFHTLKS